MKEEDKIHLLVKEIMFIEDDVDHQAKKIIHDHIHDCNECYALYSEIKKLEIQGNDDTPVPHSTMKPLKSLKKLNIGLFLFLILTRMGILLFILNTDMVLADVSLHEAMLKANINLFYLPASVFLLLLTFIFFKKRIFFIFLAWDLFVVIFGSNLLVYLI